MGMFFSETVVKQQSSVFSLQSWSRPTRKKSSQEWL